jgi:glycosyltransferase involved in cell wall biosynthesis
MARIVRAERVGVVAASASSSDLAVAIREVLDRPVEIRTAERLRIASLARAAYSWPATAARYQALVRTLAGPPAEQPG